MYPLNGNPICEQMKALPITGNLIPKQWYHTIVKADRKRPAPYHLAIGILGEVVFRYRPVEAPDGSGWEKSFREDLLQMSYADLAGLFNASADSVKEAVCFLEELRVLRRVLRTVKRAGRSLHNVLYLELKVERLRELTLVPGDAAPPLPEESPSPSGEVCPHTPDKIPPTYPEKNHKTVSYTPGKLAEDPGGQAGGLPPLPFPEQKVTSLAFETEEELTALLRQAVHYDWYMATGYLVDASEEEKERWREVYRTVVEGMAGLCCFPGAKRFSFGVRTAKDALRAFERLLPYGEGDGLAALAEAVTAAYLAESGSRAVRDPAAYLSAMLLCFAEHPEEHGLT